MKTGGYIVRVMPINGGSLWAVVLLGVNGKRVFPCKGYKKRSYAIRQAKSFVAKVQGRVKLDV